MQQCKVCSNNGNPLNRGGVCAVCEGSGVIVVTLRGPERAVITNFEEAVTICAGFRARGGLGASEYYNFRIGRILNDQGRMIARVHYNGRVEIRK